MGGRAWAAGTEEWPGERARRAVDAKCKALHGCEDARCGSSARLAWIRAKATPRAGVAAFYPPHFPAGERCPCSVMLLRLLPLLLLALQQNESNVLPL